jgi:hypothetical protein
LLKPEKISLYKKINIAVFINFLIRFVFTIQTDGVLDDVRDEAEGPAMPGVVS